MSIFHAYNFHAKYSSCDLHTNLCTPMNFLHEFVCRKIRTNKVSKKEVKIKVSSGRILM